MPSVPKAQAFTMQVNEESSYALGDFSLHMSL